MRIYEKLINSLVILASLAVLVYIADDFSGQGIRRALIPKTPPPDWSQVQFPSEALPQQGTKAVFLVLSTQCGVCLHELPKYKELIRQIKTEVPKAKFATVFLQPHEVAEQFLKKEGLDVPAVDIPSLVRAVRATPTILLVDDQGKIKDSWVGAGAISPEKLVAQVKG